MLREPAPRTPHHRSDTHGLARDPSSARETDLPGARRRQGTAAGGHENRDTKPSVKPETAQGHEDSENLQIPKALQGGIFLGTCAQGQHDAGLTRT